MWSQYYHSTVSQLLLESLLKLCSENIPCEETLEIDGIICISPGDVTKQIVVKFHEIVDRGRHLKWQQVVPKQDLSPECSTYLPDHADGDIYEKEDVTIVHPKLGNSQSNDHDNREFRKYFDEKNGEDTHDTHDTSESPVPQLKSLLPSRQIVPLTKKKGKHKSQRRRDVMQWANGHTHSSAIGNCDYQISIDQPTVIEEQANLDDSGASVSDLKSNTVDSSEFGQDDIQDNGGAFVEGSERAIICRVCHKSFSRYINLQTHNMQMHKRWTCKQCYSTFSMRCNLRRHERLHAGHKPHPCRICNKAFSRKGDLKIHEMKHEASGDMCNLICEACSQFFTSRGMYDNHVCAGHPASIKCEIDDDSSSMPTSADDLPLIEVPSLISQDDSNNSCSFEPGSATASENPVHNPSLSLLTDSLASGLASGGKVFKIEKDFHDMSSSPQSIFYDKFDKPNEKYEKFDNPDWSGFLVIPSPQRSRQVSPVTNADHSAASQDSNNIPSNNSPHTSVKGGAAAYKSSSSNTNTKLEPSEDKEFTCCLCKLLFFGYSSYDAHCQRQHLRFPCHLCDQTFTNRNNRSRHVRNHTGNKCYSCDICGKSFTRSDILREHQIIHTESYIGDTCSYCGQGIKKKAELLAHIKKCCRKRKSCLPLESATADLKAARPDKCSSPANSN